MDMPAVRNLLNAHWDLRLPVNVELIAHSLGYEIKVLTPFDPENYGLSGMAAVENNRKVIYVSKTDHPNRQRFTIAHEIAHHYLGHTRDGERKFRDNPNHYSTGHQEQVELEANEFAAELLMPSEAVLALIERKGITNPTQLASIFDVSESAMYWRLKNMRLIY